MKREQILSTIIHNCIIPVIRAHNPVDGLQAAEAVYRGGISTIEVAMTVPGAIGVMEKLAAHLSGKVLLGAGTVLDAETARAAILAGAEFILAPSLNLRVIEMAHRYSKAAIPGALTPTEVLTAWEAGADFVKVFPAANVGGPKYIKALKAPLPQVELIPVGGVNLETAADYLRAGAAALGIGGELVDAQALAGGRLDIIEENARRFMARVREARSAAAAV